MQNKAKLGRAGVRGVRTAGTNEGQMRQTNPIWATAKQRASGLQERIYGESYREQASEKQSQFAGPAPDGRRPGSHRWSCRPGVLRQTKPIPRLRIADWGRTGCGTPTGRPAAPSMLYKQKTNPICRLVAGAATGGNRAKQTQFPGGTRPGGRARGGDCAKQTQFEDGPKEG
jgi:hypothetical protein